MEDIPALWIEFRTSDSNHRGLHRLPAVTDENSRRWWSAGL